MDPTQIQQEVQALLEVMGFGQDIETVESHQGITSRFNIRIKNRGGEEISADASDYNPNVGFDRIPASHLLIGEKGANLAALEYLLKRLLSKKSGGAAKFTLDINDYRIRRLEELKQDVKAAAKEVRLYKKEVPLRIMPPFERRSIHLLLAEYPDITTESVGEEPNRRVVIKPYP